MTQMSELSKDFLSKLKVSLYWQQICYQMAEEGTHIVFAYDINDNLVGQSNSLHQDLRYSELIQRQD